MADEKLQIVRHSCAHVMAEAILNLYPGTKIAIGPAIDNGFYYDFDFPEGTKFTETDFPAVEKEMRKILAGNHEFVRKEVSKEEALKLFADQDYKVELINDLPADATITTSGISAMIPARSAWRSLPMRQTRSAPRCVRPGLMMSA